MDTTKRGRSPRKKRGEYGEQLTSEYVFFLDPDIDKEAEERDVRRTESGLSKKSAKFFKSE